MPFVRTAVRQGTDASQKQLIVESIHNALVQAIGMPEDELFNLGERVQRQRLPIFAHVQWRCPL